MLVPVVSPLGLLLITVVVVVVELVHEFAPLHWVEVAVSVLVVVVEPSGLVLVCTVVSISVVSLLGGTGGKH
ncbi:hypothetical protein D3C85_1715360 [compost metagenome]